MPNFTPIRDVPQQGLSEWEFSLLSALKENVEVMTGTRQSGVHVLTNDMVSVQPQDVQQMKQVTATGAGINISGSLVAEYNDYVKLINNVQTLANDVARLQYVVNSLLNVLRG